MAGDIQNIKLKLVLLLLVWGMVFSPVVLPMVNVGLSDSDNSHTLLVPLVSFYFLWKRREAFLKIPIQGSSFGLGVLIVSLSIYFFSYLGGIAFFSRLMLVVSLIGLLWSFLGTPMIRLLAFPLLFLFFMVPIPDTLLGMVAFPLQIVSAKISTVLLQFCSIPVYREGNILHLVQTQFEVAEACSGIRSIMSLTMLSVIFAYLSSGHRWHKTVLILSAVPIALLANILRVSGTGILAHFYGDHVARGFLHEFAGLAVFLFGLAALFFVYSILMWLRSVGR